MEENAVFFVLYSSGFSVVYHPACPDECRGSLSKDYHRGHKVLHRERSGIPTSLRNG